MEPSTRPATKFNVLKANDAFCVPDLFGGIRADLNADQGFYLNDCRHLSRLELRVGGTPPLRLASNLAHDGSMLSVDLTNSDVYGMGDQQPLVRESIHIIRQAFLWNNTLHQRLRIKSYYDQRLLLVLQHVFDADFADIFEIRGTERRNKGVREPAAIDGTAVLLRYIGRDEIKRETIIRFDPKPDALAVTSAVHKLQLEPQAEMTIHMVAEARQSIDPRISDSEPQNLLENYRAMRRSWLSKARHRPHLFSSNELFNGWINRSVSDLHMLLAETGQGNYPHAGTPWFNTAFGRDGIITALLALEFQPDIAAGVLRYLAATQATEEDAYRDATPGKILHETRRGEMARTGEVPYAAYYGSVDSTPLFIMLAHWYLRRTGNTNLITDIWPAIRSALNWIDQYGDLDGDGFVEYQRERETGLSNQGWKDSGDAISHADGSLATGPIALCEVQAYVHAAKMGAAHLADFLDDKSLAASLRRESHDLARRFNERFWDDELGAYVLALDGDKQPCRVLTSNAGHTLITGIVDPEKVARLVDTLTRASMFSGWGLRTMSAGEARYSPLSYHNGSVWPHDTAIVALGMARHGYSATAARMMTGLFEASLYMGLNRLPELFCGFPKMRFRSPVDYADACSPQAWSSAACYGMLTAILGISINGVTRQVRIASPELPDYLDSIRVDGLSVGDQSLGLQFERDSMGKTTVVPVGTSGDVELILAL